MPTFKVYGITLATLTALGFLFTSQVLASSDDTYVVSTSVKNSTHGWVKGLECKMYVTKGKLSKLEIPYSGTTVDFFKDTITVYSSSDVLPVRFDPENFDPELIYAYPDLQLVYRLFLEDTAWTNYRDNMWESKEPLIVPSKEGVQQLKAWLLIGEESKKAENMVLIDSDNKMYEIILSYLDPAD